MVQELWPRKIDMSFLTFLDGGTRHKLTEFVAVVLLLLSNAGHAGETLDRVLSRKTMVVAVEPGYPPFSFLNGQNQMDGFDVDIAKAVAGRLGVTLRIDTPACEIMNAGNWGGRWDVCICSMTPDQRKAKVLDFAVPYYQSPVVIVTTMANNTLQSASDISGRKIGVEHGSTYERYLQHDLDLSVPGSNKISYPFGRVNIVPYGSEDLAYQDLALGAGKRVDAVISNHGAAKYRMDKAPGKFRIVGQPLYAEPNWIAMDKGDPEWQQKIRAIIGDLKTDGTLGRISRKWLGEDVTR
jgi:polar amino acid transport system substrate-binding protein